MRVVVCDDHEMFLDALVVALGSYGHEVVGAASAGPDLLALVETHQPDVVILDVQLQDASGIDLARRVRGTSPRTAVVLLTASTEACVRRAFDDRVVDGLVGKTCAIDALDLALRRVVAGQRTIVGWPPVTTTDRGQRRPADRLTDRELQVLRLITDGKSTSAMAAQLGVSVNTVRTHVRGVLQKLDVHHRAKAAIVAHELGLVPQH